MTRNGKANGKLQRFDFAELKRLRESFHESPETFVRRFDGRISGRAWRMWESGEGKPGPKMIELIVDSLDLSITAFLKERAA